MSILGAAITGIYAVGYQLGMVLSVLAAAFNKTWSPYLLDNKFIESSEFIIYFSLAFFSWDVLDGSKLYFLYH